MYLLVDTGADSTILHPAQWRWMGVSFKRLRNPVPTIGVGGEAVHFSEPCVVAFEHAAGGYSSHEIDVALAPILPGTAGLPAVLGRDVLTQFGRVTVDFARAEVVLE